MGLRTALGIKTARSSQAACDGLRNEHAFAESIAYPKTGRSTDVAHRVWARFLDESTIADDCRLGMNAWCTGGPEKIQIRSRAICRGILLCDRSHGMIQVGELAYIGDGVIVSSRASVKIGARVLIAHNVQIFDNNSHPTNSEERHADYLNIIEGRKRYHHIPSAPIEIGDDCWIGMGAIILKGVKIGNRSIVGAGSVVTHSIGEDCTVAGNPARKIAAMNSDATQAEIE